MPELARLRLSSIDSVEADADLLDALADEPRLMPHLHLSLQAGDDLILKRMKRRHSRADAIAFCDSVRRLRPDVVFGADIIAGFPTETEEMFARSLDLVDECGLTQLHVFPFSPRPGTPAARMPQLDRARRQGARPRACARRARRRCAAHLDAQVGARRRVLAERGGIGRTEQFMPVRLAAPVEPGIILEVHHRRPRWPAIAGRLRGETDERRASIWSRRWSSSKRSTARRSARRSPKRSTTSTPAIAS